MVSVLLLGACSDPVPPAAQGAFAFANSGQSCTWPAGTASLGEGIDTLCPPFASGLSVGDNRLVDGDDEGKIKFSCQVTADNYISVSGSRRGTSSAISIRGQAVEGGELQFVALSMDAITLNPSADDPCVITKIHDIAAGRVWASFACPALVDSSSPGSQACAVSEGCFLFENCDE